MIGQVLDGKYAILSQLGAGAMGAVLEGRHVSTHRRVAIKVINKELATSASLVARFQREARAAGSIESRHIAQVLDAGTDVALGSPYLVMELLEGGDLQSMTQQLGPLRPGLALRVVGQALSGLERAHGANVVHRDIKPANIYVARSEDGHRTVKIVDFGIAKVKDDLGASKHALTQTATLLGSPLYMSPEQAKQSRNVDARADLWSIGIVLYELLSGKTPHARAETLTELLLAICTEQAKPVQDSAPWVPPEIARIVDRALRLDQTQRYASATEMLADIRAIVPDFALLLDPMLSSMSAEERAFVAVRSVPVTIKAAGSISFTGSDPRTQTGPGDTSATLLLESSAAQARSAHGFAASQSAPGAAGAPKRRLSLVVGAAGTIAVAAAVGVVAFALTGASRRMPEPARLEGNAIPATESPPVPPPRVSAEPSATASVEVAVATPPASASSPASATPLPAAPKSLTTAAAVRTAVPTSSAVARPPAKPAAASPSGGILREYE